MPAWESDVSPMADIFYQNEKLWRAVEILATHPGRIRDRLIKACHEAWVFVHPDLVTEELRAFYNKVQANVTSEPRTDEDGSFKPSIRRLSEEDASKMANHILSLAIGTDKVVNRKLDERHG